MIDEPEIDEEGWQNQFVEIENHHKPGHTVDLDFELFSEEVKMDQIYPCGQNSLSEIDVCKDVASDATSAAYLLNAVNRGSTYSAEQSLIPEGNHTSHLDRLIYQNDNEGSSLHEKSVPSQSLSSGDKDKFLKNISEADLVLRFPEFHKIRNTLLPLLNEEVSLDSDLRCLLRSQLNNSQDREFILAYLPALEEGLAHLRQQEKYYIDLYCSCPGNFGAVEVAIVKCRLNWTQIRLQFKRRYLYILLAGESAHSQDHEPGPVCLHGEIGSGKQKNQAATHFVATGVAKPRTNFSKAAKLLLREWFDQHKDSPYPTDEEKDELAQRSGLLPSQISTWFINERMRNWNTKRKQLDTSPDSTKNKVARLNE